MVGEEIEAAEIVPGDLGAHGIDAIGGEVGHELGHRRVADAHPGVAGIDADGVDARRPVCAPIRANIEVIPAPDRRAG